MLKFFVHSFPRDKSRKFLLEQENTFAEDGKKKKNSLHQDESESSGNCPPQAALHNSQGYYTIQIK